MANTALLDFIDAHRDELIGRCRAKVAKRTAPPPTEAEIDHGVPLFLSQLSRELSNGRSATHEISKSALEHGHDLRTRGFTIAQVVHDYGDVCQSITDLAVETHSAIAAADFRTLNRCLDDAIAGAVTEFAREPEPGSGNAVPGLRSLVTGAITAFESLQSGRVGFGGATAGVLDHYLRALLARLDRGESEPT